MEDLIGFCDDPYVVRIFEAFRTGDELHGLALVIYLSGVNVSEMNMMLSCRPILERKKAHTMANELASPAGLGKIYDQ